MIPELLLSLLLFLPPSGLWAGQSIYYLRGVKSRSQESALVTPRTLSIIVPIKGENPNTLNGLLRNLANINYPISNLEVVVISDDDPERFQRISEEIRAPQGLEVQLFRREERRGFKSAALAYGLRKVKGELVMTLDVDSRLPADSLQRALNKMEREECDAVTLTWVGYGNSDSALSKGLAVSTKFGSVSLLLGRYASGMKVFPVGSGTIYRKSSLLLVGGWDPDVIQDDLDLGARMISKGLKVCASEAEVQVQVPEDLKAYYVQQTRWAMGGMEVLSRHMSTILQADSSLIKKMDLLFYLTQYFPVATTFLGALILAILSPWGKFGFWVIFPFSIWLVSIAIYTYLLFKEARREGLSLRETLLALGRVSAYTVSISPFIFLWIFKAFSKGRTYVVTPKGKSGRVKIIYPMAILGVLLMVAAILYLIRLQLLPGLWLLYYSFPYLYTPLKNLRE
jgi:cellulose synthase/poly-beta-1,6-N-acetylglucosamine synthase-like glycosyltransferase